MLACINMNLLVMVVGWLNLVDYIVCEFVVSHVSVVFGFKTEYCFGVHNFIC